MVCIGSFFAAFMAAASEYSAGAVVYYFLIFN